MTRIAGSAVSLRRTSATIARSAVEHYLVQVHLTGGCAGLAAGREFELQAGDVGVLDLTRCWRSRPPISNPRLVVPAKACAARHRAGCPAWTGPAASSAVGELLADHVRALYASFRG
ncbi:hypothetical protein D3877_23235 [Azospirillum cavernae]|uniref:Uncharacterized protein n=1 Tax=Azospirillum cavernae TaxID=2320860 RepID=A0A418VP36_9PROT|nr:hypothetical protein [Azospirillum cavernae]RJF78048.1 hypothetical protein D3877_23235 [Azospirillum cavernae]